MEQLKCRIKPISRNESFIFASGYIFRTLKTFNVDFTVQFKSALSRNYHQVFAFKNLDICQLTKIALGNGMMNTVLRYVNQTFQGVIHECPYSGWLRVINGTFNIASDKNDLDRLQLFPNGNYKWIVFAFNKRDPNIFTGILYYDLYSRENAVNNYENL